MTACTPVSTYSSDIPRTPTSHIGELEAVNQGQGIDNIIQIPPQNASWQWVLSEAPDLSIDADMFDLDLFDTPATTIQTLHESGAMVICYLSAGTWEDWRPDQEDFPSDVIGKRYAGWPGERWLDISQMETLTPIMHERLQLCKSKGFDGVEPDNIDGFTNDTGFELTEEDQLRYNIWLAEEAHRLGLSIGLKNDPEQASALQKYFDWALVEECFWEGWCNDLQPFIDAGKAVFAAEYSDTGIQLEEICNQAKELRINVLFKNRELDNYFEICR